jgi:hypothetical protein
LAIYELAFHLHLPIYKLESEMTYEELLGWFSYFEQRPVGWREDDRTMKYLQTQGVKEKPWNIFASLDPIYNRNKSEGFNVSNFKHSGLFQKLLGAGGGDRLDL